MPDFDNTNGGGGQDGDNNDFTPKVIPFADPRIRLDKLEPKTARSGKTTVSERSPASEWPEPDLSVLQPNRRPPPKLPLDVFGDRWAQWIEDAAQAAVAPVDYVVAPLLPASSALIGNARWPQAWPGWKEPPHLWGGAVGDSGDGKSPGADAIISHVLPFVERRMVADFPDTQREKQTEIEAAKVRMESWKEEVRDAVKNGTALPPQPGPVPREPIEPVLMMSDTTIERVASLLATATPKGVLLTRDELAGWLLGMNAYNEGGRAFWLEAYGGRRYRVDRQKLAEPIIIPHLAVSWYGGIQPAKVVEIMQGADDGLMARFMWFWPNPFPFEQPSRPPATDWAIMAFDRLRMLELAVSNDGPTPLVVPLDDAAKRRLVRFGKLMQEQKETTTGLMRSAIGKARGLVLRLSLVLEYLRWCGEDGYTAPPDTITEDAVCAAARFVSEYVLPMAERTYSDAASPETDSNTMRLAHWIKKERPEFVHVRNMQRSVRLAGLRDAKTIHAACAALIEAGWLAKPTTPAGGQHRGAKAYPISPRLWEVL
jgi:hypothetical protein